MRKEEAWEQSEAQSNRDTEKSTLGLSGQAKGAALEWLAHKVTKSQSHCHTPSTSRARFPCHSPKTTPQHPQQATQKGKSGLPGISGSHKNCWKTWQVGQNGIFFFFLGCMPSTRRCVVERCEWFCLCASHMPTIHTNLTCLDVGLHASPGARWCVNVCVFSRGFGASAASKDQVFVFQGTGEFIFHPSTTKRKSHVPSFSSFSSSSSFSFSSFFSSFSSSFPPPLLPDTFFCSSFRAFQASVLVNAHTKQ